MVETKQKKSRKRSKNDDTDGVVHHTTNGTKHDVLGKKKAKNRKHEKISATASKPEKIKTSAKDDRNGDGKKWNPSRDPDEEDSLQGFEFKFEQDMANIIDDADNLDAMNSEFFLDHDRDTVNDEKLGNLNTENTNNDKKTSKGKKVRENDKVQKKVHLDNHRKSKDGTNDAGKTTEKIKRKKSKKKSNEQRTFVDAGIKSVDSFQEMHLDPRLIKAVEKLKYQHPTPIQSSLIPVIQAGRDVLTAAPTGSGKTAAYAIPIVNTLIGLNRDHRDSSLVKAVVLVPTKELAYQVTSVFKNLLLFTPGVRASLITGKTGDLSAQIIIGTPSALVGFVTKNVQNKVLTEVEYIVVDEADLVLSYGYEQETRDALALIPSSAQSILVSATLGEDITSLRKVVLRRPLVVKVTADLNDDGSLPTSLATHHYASLSSDLDKYLVTYAILRLGVLIGKILIFVNSVEAAFRLKLFLDQFSIRTAVLNSELPVNSRIHCVEQFNAGIFDILIATDEDLRKNTNQFDEKKQKDAHFGVSRGLDFQKVTAVLNFDCPLDDISYTHRAGRTARAGNTGTVLTILTTSDQTTLLNSIVAKAGITITPLAFRMEQVEPFRYRVEDCYRGVTKDAIRDARIKDVEKEMLNSDKLQQYFQENPTDLEALKHDRSLSTRHQPHLAHIPNYLLPPALRSGVDLQSAPGTKTRQQIKNFKRNLSSINSSDPLKSFSMNAKSSKQKYMSRSQRSKIKYVAKKQANRVLKNGVIRKKRKF